MTSRKPRSPVRDVVREEVKTWCAVAVIGLIYWGLRAWL